ncbi:hypothetical protein GEMRC1_003892 [Eukaryota sp. GEM-RC1]
MRIQRNKKNRKIATFYRIHFKIQPKYKVLVDGTVTKHCLEANIDLKQVFKDLLGDDTKFYMSPCVLSELISFGPSFTQIAATYKEFSSIKCKHTPAKPPLECFDSLLNVPHNHYILATQDSHLINHCNRFAGVPIISVKGMVPMFLEPSPASKAVVNQKEVDKLKPIPTEVDQPIDVTTTRKRRGPRQPNPLSCLPPKKKSKGDNTRVRSRKPKSEE